MIYSCAINEPYAPLCSEKGAEIAKCCKKLLHQWAAEVNIYCVTQSRGCEGVRWINLAISSRNPHWRMDNWKAWGQYWWEMLDMAWDWVHKQDFMLWFSHPWNCCGTNLVFGKNQSCFQHLTPRICYESQNNWKTGYPNQAAYTHGRDKGQCNSCHVMVPHDPNAQIFAMEIIQSSGKQNFNQLQSFSKQLENFNNWLHEGVRNKVAGQAGIAEFVWDLLHTERLAKYSTFFRGYIYKCSWNFIPSVCLFIFWIFPICLCGSVQIQHLHAKIGLDHLSSQYLSSQRHAHSFSIKTMSKVRGSVTVN